MGAFAPPPNNMLRNVSPSDPAYAAIKAAQPTSMLALRQALLQPGLPAYKLWGAPAQPVQPTIAMNPYQRQAQNYSRVPGAGMAPGYGQGVNPYVPVQPTMALNPYGWGVPQGVGMVPGFRYGPGGLGNRPYIGDPTGQEVAPYAPAQPAPNPYGRNIPLGGGIAPGFRYGQGRLPSQPYIGDPMSPMRQVTNYLGPPVRQGQFQYGGQVQYAPAQVLHNFQMGLPPRSYYNMLPSQRDFLGSIVSGLGMPPEDFSAQVERGFPTAPSFWNAQRSDY